MTLLDRSDERISRQEARNSKLAEVKRDDERIRKIVIQALMSEQRGRRYVWLELAAAHIFESTIAFQPGGSLITAFREGERKVGLRLLADVTRWCPNEYMKMTVENSTVEIKDEIDDGRASGDDE